MNRSGLRPRLAALLISIVTCVGLLSLSTASAWAAAGTITEFPIPTKSDHGRARRQPLVYGDWRGPDRAHHHHGPRYLVPGPHGQ